MTNPVSRVTAESEVEVLSAQRIYEVLNAIDNPLLYVPDDILIRIPAGDIRSAFNELQSLRSLSSDSVSDGSKGVIERFEPFANEDDGEFRGMGRVPDGDWVRHSDHIAALDSGTGGQQPVAWWCEHGDGSIEVVMWPDARDKYAARGYAVTPLYPSPTEPKAGVVSEDMVERAAEAMWVGMIVPWQAAVEIAVGEPSSTYVNMVEGFRTSARRALTAALNGGKPTDGH